MRKINTFILGSLLLITSVLTGCKSIANLTAKDGGNKNKRTAVKPNSKPVFLEDIEVTPGSVVQSKHKPGTTKQKKTNIPIPKQMLEPDTTVKGNIELCNILQFRYAIIMDETVERLSNIKLLNKINEWWGTPYCMGGKTKDCIDCSSFTQAMVRDIYKAELPRTAQEQYDACQHIDYEDLREGDLVFFHAGRRRKEVTHVGLYLSNNKFVHSSSSNGVIISDLNESYWRHSWRGGGRVVITAP